MIEPNHSVESSSQSSNKQSDEVFRDLAKLSATEYDRIRNEKAKELSIRTCTLDAEVLRCKGKKEESLGFKDVEPFSEPIEPSVLLNEIYSLVKKYIICEEYTAIAATLWIVFTWLIDCFDVAPIAAITAPEKRCGKSQLLFLFGRLCKRPLAASNISSAALYRSIEKWGPTLTIDEADAFMRENEELRGIINSGHTRESAYVIRVVGDDHTPARFSTWGAKAIAGIGNLSETIMDRSIILSLRRKLPDENVERLRHSQKSDFNILTQKLARFYIDYKDQAASLRPKLPNEINDRAQDNWEPLMVIAELAGGDWPQKAWESALTMNMEDVSVMSTSAELLSDIRELFSSDMAPSRFSTRELLNRLIENEESSWYSYNRGKALSARQLINRLREFKIEPKQFRDHQARTRGYERSQFEEAWTRYLAPPEIRESVGQSNDSKDLSVTRRKRSHVTDSVHVTENLTNCLNLLERHTGTPKNTPPQEDLGVIL